MKKIFYLIICAIFVSCAKDTLREKTTAFVYYQNAPVKHANILTWHSYSKGFVKEAETDSMGYFELKEIIRYSLGVESHSLSQRMIIVKGKLQSDTLATLGGKVPQNMLITDTVTLKLMK